MKTEPDHASRPHAEFGPSSLKHIHHCPGWVSRGGTSEAAEMGTRIHEAVEIRNPSALHDEKELQIYHALIQDLDQQLESLAAITGITPTIHQEIRLEMKLNGCETFGTADIVAIAGDCALLHDHKTGVGRVDSPPENWQSLAYAVGVFQQFPQVHTIIASFSLPQRNELLEGNYYRGDLDRYVQMLSDTINAAAKVRPQWTDTSAPSFEDLSISNSCQYCLHRDRCPALGHTAQEIADRYRPDLLPPGPIDSSNVDDPEVLARLYAVAKVVEKWAEGIIFKAVGQAKDGVQLPGLRLKSLGAKRNVVDKVGFVQYAESIGMSVGEIIELVEIPFGKVRDAYAAKAPKGKKTEYARRFEAGCESDRLLEKGSERITLVQE